MPFSHHSHSGQFCAHAKDSLEQMVQKAISLNMKMYALTEHMPRGIEDFYPEEINVFPTAESLARLTDDFLVEAKRLKAKYESQIELLIGFESEWIRPESLALIKTMHDKYPWDFFVGSVHHVHTVPVDFDRKMYEEARTKSGGTDEQLFGDYFDSQYEMLKAITPPVVGHFDLIRLLSDNPNQSMQESEKVWSKVLRNLDYVASYGGALEINTAALRKGMYEAYPAVDICKEFVRLGGEFVLSDDAHSRDQVGTNYHKLLVLLRAAGIQRLHFFSSQNSGGQKANLLAVAVSELDSHALLATAEP